MLKAWNVIIKNPLNVLKTKDHFDIYLFKQYIINL